MFYYQSPILGMFFFYIQPFLETVWIVLIIYTNNKISLIEFETHILDSRFFCWKFVLLIVIRIRIYCYFYVTNIIVCSQIYNWNKWPIFLFVLTCIFCYIKKCAINTNFVSYAAHWWEVISNQVYINLQQTLLLVLL